MFLTKKTQCIATVPLEYLKLFGDAFKELLPSHTISMLIDMEQGGVSIWSDKVLMPTEFVECNETFWKLRESLMV
jgi:hypothetical protein